MSEWKIWKISRRNKAAWNRIENELYVTRNIVVKIINLEKIIEFKLDVTNYREI